MIAIRADAQPDRSCKENPLAGMRTEGRSPGRERVRRQPARKRLQRWHQQPSGELTGNGSETALFHTAIAKTPRAQLSQFLVASAQKAAKARDWAKAIPYYQALVVARGPASPEAKQLATIWTLAGQNEQAADAWTAYGSALKDKFERDAAFAEVVRLEKAPDPFADRLRLTPLAADAKRAFTLGRAAFAKQLYGDALVYFHIGYALAPSCRALQRARLDVRQARRRAPKREFYRRYPCSGRSGPTPTPCAASSRRSRRSARCSWRRACRAPRSG
jgi:tetratricopeptide (TPR) repeat protein